MKTAKKVSKKTPEMPRAASPDVRGFFGGEDGFGGRYIPETLMPACEELAREYESAKRDPAFRKELDGLLTEYAGGQAR